eukprot:2281719-Prymnesium_polylepis.1
MHSSRRDGAATVQRMEPTRSNLWGCASRLSGPAVKVDVIGPPFSNVWCAVREDRGTTCRRPTSRRPTGRCWKRQRASDVRVLPHLAMLRLMSQRLCSIGHQVERYGLCSDVPV